MHANEMIELVSEKVVSQRIRNRIIEVLGLFSDEGGFEAARGNLEFWEDWASIEQQKEFGPPVFSKDELIHMALVSEVWEHVSLNSSKESKEWIGFSRVSKRAHEIFMLRGKQSEDVENA